MTTTITDHLEVARAYASTPDDWPLAPRYNAAHRWSHRLAATDDVEVWLLTWLPGQGTEVHDHGGSAGAFVVVEGELTEETFAGVRPAARQLATGDGRRFGPHHVHRVTNNGARPAVSIHVYGPALTTMTRYALVDGALVVEAVDRAGISW
jgi:mannose-6-phosphate isomerase-like protein (cupin superfamily)